MINKMIKLSVKMQGMMSHGQLMLPVTGCTVPVPLNPGNGIV